MRGAMSAASQLRFAKSGADFLGAGDALQSLPWQNPANSIEREEANPVKQVMLTSRVGDPEVGVDQDAALSASSEETLDFKMSVWRGRLKVLYISI